MYVTCSQENLDKEKNLVEELYNYVVIGVNNLLDRKEPEDSVGFLVHLSQTFTALLTYFK